MLSKALKFGNVRNNLKLFLNGGLFDLLKTIQLTSVCKILASSWVGWP